ncbi:DNA polymerase III subunit gamma/tau [bacterium]|nr:DNA polymerase III subunit gamma/tau [bacterium]
MSYVVLARKYRPKNFDEVLGQETPISILESFIKNNSIPHALIFCGGRGIGKTSMARIFAKAINSEEIINNPQVGEDIDGGKSLDVIEIDAASNNGVDQIRDIIDISQYSSLKCKYKVFIIDEAHMLSKAAFNALLKTLEEPNDNTIFILATTEVEKIPITISSRCQLISFTNLNSTKIEDLVKNVCDSENINIDEESIKLLANEANGSARDSLSILELLSNSLNKDIKYKSAISKLGITPKETVYLISINILNGNIKESIEIFSEICSKGYDVKKFILSLMFFFRSLIYAKLKINSEDSTIEKIEEDILTRFEEFSVHEFENIFDNLINSYDSIIKSPNVKISTETAIIKLCLISDFISFETISDEEPKKKVKTINNDNIDKNKDLKRFNIDNKEKSNEEKKNGSTIETHVDTNSFNLKENKDKLFESESIKSLFDTFDCRILEIEKENQE